MGYKQSIIKIHLKIHLKIFFYNNYYMTSNADVNVITLQQSEIKKRSIIDYTKKEFTKEEKYVIQKEVDVIKQKYPTYIPIIVRPRDKNIRILKYKYLVGSDINVGQFLNIIRNKITDIKSGESIFIFINNIVPIQTMSLSSIYNLYKDEETGMLFITICRENTFGFL